jgi:hypothetical protein
MGPKWDPLGNDPTGPDKWSEGVKWRIVSILSPSLKLDVVHFAAGLMRQFFWKWCQLFACTHFLVVDGAISCVIIKFVHISFFAFVICWGFLNLDKNNRRQLTKWN